MSEYIVTARKWRPMRFEDVVGQDHVTVTLRNALGSDRLAHAYLFSGPRGVGKTTTARLLAKAVNCLAPQENNPDNACEMCREITEGRSFDVLEIDGASNRGVEEIRNLRESARYAPARGKYKVYIIDEVHMLTKEAFNALLKTLEEPPTHVLFLFATTEVHKVPATILSRCQRFDFRRIAVDEIIANLKAIASEEGLRLDDDALMLIARKGDGSLRDAQSMFDQVISLCGKDVTHHQILEALHIVDQEIYFRVTDLIKARDARAGLELVDEMMRRGYDIKEFLSGLAEHLRNFLMAKATGSTGLIEASDHFRKRYAQEAEDFTVADLLRLLRMVNDTETSLRWSTQPRFKLEADMVQLISLPRAPEVGDLIQRIDELKKKLDTGSSLTSSISRVAVTGNVPATAPLTRTAQRRDRTTPGTASPPVTAVQNEGTRTTLLNNGEISSRWQEFVSEVRRERISLGSVLESSSLVGSSGSAIRLACANEFQASSIKRQRDFLGDILHRVFRVRARVDVEVNPTLSHQPAPGAPSETNSTPGGEHPVVRAMIRELGAEPLE